MLSSAAPVVVVVVVVGVVFVAGVIVVDVVSMAVVVSESVVSVAVPASFDVTVIVSSPAAVDVVNELETVVAVAGVVRVGASSAVSAALPNTFFFFNGLTRSFLGADCCENN